jgi:hypothetical protein
VLKRPLPILACLLALGLSLALAACGGGGGETTTAQTTAPTAEGPATAGETGGASTSPEEEAGKTIVQPKEESGAKNETEPAAKPGTKADKKEIEAAIVASVSEKDPANCTTVEAPGFIEQTTGQSGQAALHACEVEARLGAKEAHETVKVSKIEATTESAIADATLSGAGALDGQTIEIALRKEDGRWRLGRLVGFDGFDRPAFSAAVGETMKAQGGPAAEAHACVEANLEKVSRKEIENSILVGSAPDVVQAYNSCH